MKKILFPISAIILFLNSCNDSDNSTVIYKSDWEKIIQLKSERIELPELLNVIQLDNIERELLVQSESTDSIFYILSLPNLTKKVAYGIKSDGPDGFTNYPTLIYNRDPSKRNSFGVYDKRRITILEHKKNISKKASKESVGGYGIYHAIYQLSDSLFCIKYANKESFNIELINLYNGHIYDKISFPEGNNEKKRSPFHNDGTLCVYNNKIIYGRGYYDQIDIYEISKQNTTIQHTLTIKEKNATFENIPENAKERSYYYLENICCDKDYIYMLNQEDLPEKRDKKRITNIDIYNWSGKQICRLELDIWVTWCTKIDNQLYLRSKTDDDAIYRISLDKSLFAQ